ncbi:enoyl-CoA hydratase/isomerase family protein [Noviherbaspirillum sedimenti]|uniref:Enoyl-CoA hydratase/isomerase family protein n=1 Tax=Noviherbaspirillum sedimenti TaxID=2320865 RepID=A0A3A3G9L9_9BURK|nr:enoyl-CoA hydratase/isomerase family protein [Noviherbaspirillum sedimenti]
MNFYTGYRSLSFQQEGRILKVIINTAEKKNAVDDNLHQDLARVFYDINSDPDTDIVILTGIDRWFCAGGDMTWFQELIDEPHRWNEMIVEAKRIINGLLELEKPIIARINGAAAGLGASLALMCDIIVADESALIGDPHVRMGLVAGDGGAVIWPQLVGFAKAKEMLLTGRMLTAKDAAGMGLINYAVPANALDDKVNALARELAEGATMAIRWTKTVMNLELRRISGLLTDAALAYETVTNASKDHQEAVRAFVAKRKPNFEGR